MVLKSFHIVRCKGTLFFNQRNKKGIKVTSRGNVSNTVWENVFLREEVACSLRTVGEGPPHSRSWHAVWYPQNQALHPQLGLIQAL